MLTDVSIQSLRDRILLLRSLPAFSSLEDEALTLLAEHVRVRACRGGEVLMNLGEPIHHAYVVLEGELLWQRKGRAPTVTDVHGVVGWLTLLARDSDGMMVQAVGPALLLELPAEALEHALEDDFGIIRNSMRIGGQALLSARGNLPAPQDRPPSFAMGVRTRERRTLVERLIDMRQVPLFEHANVEALIALARSGKEVSFEPGEEIWQIGDSADHWLLIEYGRVRCTSPTGEQQDVGATFAIGVMDSIAQAPRGYRALADTLVVANRLEIESFLGVLEAHFDLARDYVAFVSKTVLDLQADQREGLLTRVEARQN